MFLALSLTRPEGAIYFFVALLTRILIERKKVFHWKLFLWGGLFLVPFTLYHILHFFYFRDIFPNTYYAKVDSNGIFRLINLDKQGWNYVWQYFKNTRYLIFLPVVILAGPIVLRKWSRDFLGLYILVFVVPLYVVWVAGDWMCQYRFLSHYSVILLVLFFAACIPIGKGLSRFMPRFEMEKLAFVFALPFVLLAGWRVFVETPAARMKPSTHLLCVKEKGDKYNEIFDQALIQNPSVLEVDIGATSWYGRYEIIDLAKLADYHFARQGWRTYFGDYIFRERKPTILHSQEYFTRMSAWDRFSRELSEYADINPLFNKASPYFNRIRKETFCNPSTA